MKQIVDGTRVKWTPLYVILCSACDIYYIRSPVSFIFAVVANSNSNSYESKPVLIMHITHYIWLTKPDLCLHKATLRTSFPLCLFKISCGCKYVRVKTLLAIVFFMDILWTSYFRRLVLMRH